MIENVFVVTSSNNQHFEFMNFLTLISAPFLVIFLFVIFVAFKESKKKKIVYNKTYKSAEKAVYKNIT